jgi:membrane associated rhomboid family serine protease
MIPVGDNLPTLRTPVITIALLVAMWVVWLFVEGAGLHELRLAAAVCNWGMVPAELTHRLPVGFSVPITEGAVCAIDDWSSNYLTPITSMFLHGSFGHIIGNSLYFWIFGNNVEDSMGRGRFLAFYLLCGLAAAAAHVTVDPASPFPTVGASGAISGVLGGYLVLYPRTRVAMLFFPFVWRLPAWLVLVTWFGIQVITGLPSLMQVRPEVSGGVAVWAHVGGFVAGVVLVRFFRSSSLVDEHRRMMATTHTGFFHR